MSRRFSNGVPVGCFDCGRSTPAGYPRCRSCTFGPDNAVDYAALVERMDKLDKKLDRLTDMGAALIGGLGVIMGAMAEEVRGPEVASSLARCASSALATAKTFVRDE